MLFHRDNMSIRKDSEHNETKRNWKKRKISRQLTINNIQLDPVHGIVQTNVIVIAIGSAGTIMKETHEKLKRNRSR